MVRELGGSQRNPHGLGPRHWAAISLALRELAPRPAADRAFVEWLVAHGGCPLGGYGFGRDNRPKLIVSPRPARLFQNVRE